MITSEDTFEKFFFRLVESFTLKKVKDNLVLQEIVE